MKVRPAVLIIERGHVLLMRYCYGGNDVYALPGGNPDPNESLTTTLLRELNGELGIEVELSQFLMMGEVLHQKGVLHAIFGGQIIGGLPQLNPQQTSALEVVWLPVARLNTYNLYPNIGSAIQQWALGQLQNPYLGSIEQAFF